MYRIQRNDEARKHNAIRVDEIKVQNHVQYGIDHGAQKRDL
jgi:hypothetical protein